MTTEEGLPFARMRLMPYFARRLLVSLQPSLLQPSLLLILAVLMFGSAASANAATTEGSPLSAQLQRLAGTLDVIVLGAVLNGALPPPGVAPIPPVYQPVPGLTVSARLASTGSKAVQRVTDRQGHARFQLAPGKYWTYVPSDAQAPGFSTVGAPVLMLPDGTPVLAWTEVSVPAYRQAASELRIIVPQP